MGKIIRWRPGRGQDVSAVDTCVDHVDPETGEVFYRVWPAGRPEPRGNPVKWSESTLRHHFEKADDG